MESLRNKAYTTLRSSENFFKTDMIYIAKGGFWLLSGQIIAMIVGFLLSIAFANLLPKESFGIYKYILSITGIVSAFSLTGIGATIVQSAAKGFSGVLRQGFKTNLKWSVGIFIGGLVLGSYYYINGNFILACSFFLMGIFSPITSSAALYSPYLVGRKNFRANSLYGMIYNLVPAASMIAVLFVTENVLVVIAAYFISGSLVAISLYHKAKKIYPNDNTKEDPELLSYSGHLSVMDIIGRIAGNLDKILIFQSLGAAPLAIYSFAIAPVEQLQSGKKILSALIMPKVSDRPLEDLQNTLPRKSLWLIVYAFILIIVWLLLAPWFYKIFYPEYLDSIFYSQIYALTLIVVAGTPFNDTLITHKQTKALYWHRTLIPIAKIVLFLILLPIYGITGLIITHIATVLFSNTLAYYFVKHPLKSSG